MEDRNIFIVALSVIIGIVLIVIMAMGLGAQRELNRMQERSSRYQTCMQRAQTPRDCENVLGRYQPDESR